MVVLTVPEEQAGLVPKADGLEADEAGRGALTREVQQGLTVPSLPVAYLLSDVLGTLSPDPWDFPLWARARIRGKGDVI
jgi:hypothetical protein